MVNSLGTALYVTALFPSGRVVTTWERRALAAGTIALVVLVAFATAATRWVPGPFPRYESPIPSFEPRDSPVIYGLGVVVMTTYVVALGIVVAGLIRRFRVSRGDERQQMKWFAYAAGLVAATMAALWIGFSVAYVQGGVEYLISLPSEVRAVIVLNIAGFVAVPLAIAFAILRYRLYDIDILINRTIVYGATSAAIGATFWVGLVALQPLLSGLVSANELAVAASTLVSFALFQPVRRRIQDAVDRRFDRSRYDASRTLDAFADRLRDEVDLDALRGDLLGAVRQTMAPAHASLWLRGPEP
jgi:hypothetical protein